MNDLAERLVKEAIAKGVIIATAESCTGGLVSGAITSVAGSSTMFDRGFVTYSNDAKAELLGVSPDLIKNYGAVSTEVAIAMAEGALNHSKATLSVAITGIAGPGGGSVEKPVGLVHFATALKGQDTRPFEKRFGTISRDAIRHGAVHASLQALLSRLP
ncbi:MAG: CinA family protein [Alphaproteobacteria bacterium]|jgi:nicotinamide-nucleotide amidase|nr:CinA family protein [Alphaproteobacteria bacterium]